MKLRLRYSWHQAKYFVSHWGGLAFNKRNYHMTMLWFTMAFVVGGLFQLNHNQRNDDRARTDDIAEIVQVAIDDRIQASYRACVRGNEIRLNIRLTAQDLGATAEEQAVVARRFDFTDCEAIRDDALADSPTEARPGGKPGN